MNVTNTVLSDRLRRIALFVVVGLIAVGFLILGESTAVRVLGALVAVMLGVVLKAISELGVELRRGTTAIRRLEEARARSDRDREVAARDAEVRMDRVEASVSRAARQASQVQDEVNRQFAAFSEETRRALQGLSDRIDEGAGVGRRGGRVHDEAEGGPLRELGLSDSFQGIASDIDSEPG